MAQQSDPRWRAEPPRQSMPLEDRAKIFVPFDPLDGFRAALRQKELEVERERKA